MQLRPRGPFVAATGLAVIGLAACGSSTPSATATAAAHKSAFCAGNVRIDKASANVTSDSDFLNVLKAHQGALSQMAANLPAGQVGTEANQLLTAARSALSSGNTSSLNNLSNSIGGDVDTYCGVDGMGDPLPSYFGTGKGTSFCNLFLPIYNAVGDASDPSQILPILQSNKTQISQLASDAASLPASIRTQATATVNRAQTALAQNNASALNQGGSGPAQSVALYCGTNQ